MATITLDPLPLKPYASLLATIRIARLVQEFRRRLKARVQTHKKAKQSHAQYRRTFKSRASSEFEGQVQIGSIATDLELR